MASPPGAVLQRELPGLGHHRLARQSVKCQVRGSILASHQKESFRVIPKKVVPLVTRKSKPGFLWGVRQWGPRPSTFWWPET